MSSLKSKIGRAIPLQAKLSIRLLQRVGSLIFSPSGGVKIYEGELLEDQLNEVLEKYLTSKQKADSHYIEKTKKDIKWCYALYGFTPRDYFLFNFHKENNTSKLRKTFVSDIYKDYVLFSKEGSDKYAELYDKYKFYERTKEFFKRPVIFVDKHTTEDAFVDFAMRVKRLFIKPNSDSYGRGAMIADIATREEASELYTKIKGGSWMVEERLQQSQEMAKWNSSSVNTVRVNTYLTDKGFFVLAPFMRTGRKGSVVDNGGAGGIYATIDEINGTIVTDGMDEKGNSHVTHPDSHVPFRGEQIPEWQKLIEEAEAIHRNAMSDHIYISWDFAYTPNGWTVIEGNWGQFICQQSSSKKGFKVGFDKYMNGKAISK